MRTNALVPFVALTVTRLSRSNHKVKEQNIMFGGNK